MISFVRRGSGCPGIDLAPWNHLGSLLLLTLVTCGCRSPFNPFSVAQSEPNFDRLIDLEHRSHGGSSSTHPQVASRRPAGTADSPSGPATSHSPRATAAASSSSVNRRISDLDGEDLSEVPDEQLQLLRQTQLALKQSSQPAPVPGDVDREQALAAVTESQQPRWLDDESGSEPEAGEVVIRISDHDSGRPVAGAGSSSASDIMQTVGHLQSTDASASSVRTASHARGRDQVVTASQADNELPRTETPLGMDWEDHLREALRQLSVSSTAEDALAANPREQMRRQVVARLLALALNDRELMLKKIDQLQPTEQDYLGHQLTALLDAIDPSGHPVSGRRWSLVMLNQRKAHDYLTSRSNLEVNNLSFCTEVESFGVTSRFAKYQFTADQEVLLYCELDNFVSEKLKDGRGFETQLQGHYEIVDAQGKRVADQGLPLDSHICRNRRRDYFIAYRIYMPQQISPGNYALKLTIEDLKGNKFGQSEVQFQIH